MELVEKLPPQQEIRMDAVEASCSQFDNIFGLSFRNLVGSDLTTFSDNLFGIFSVTLYPELQAESCSKLDWKNTKPKVRENEAFLITHGNRKTVEAVER